MTKINMTPATLVALANGDFDNARVAATPSGIEAQEKSGQAFLTKTFDRLPKDGMSRYRETLEEIGFVFGDDADDLFIAVVPPSGWTLRPSEHSMWSYVHDENGRRRAGVFYKAAFYDRKASFYLEPRYTAQSEYRGDDGDQKFAVAKDNATGEVLYEVGPAADYTEASANEDKAEDYLTKHFPEWRNVAAYWSPTPAGLAALKGGGE